MTLLMVAALVELETRNIKRIAVSDVTAVNDDMESVVFEIIPNEVTKVVFREFVDDILREMEDDEKWELSDKSKILKRIKRRKIYEVTE